MDRSKRLNVKLLRGYAPPAQENLTDVENIFHLIQHGGDNLEKSPHFLKIAARVDLQKPRFWLHEKEIGLEPIPGKLCETLHLTPLMLAVRQNKPGLVRYLCSRKVDVNTPNHFGSTAMHEVTNYNRAGDRPEVLNILLSHGGDPNRKNHAQKTPFMNAAEDGEDALVQIMLRRCRIPLHDKAEALALTRTETVVNLLANTGISLNSTEYFPNGETLLTRCVKNVAPEETYKVGWLLSAKADPNQANSQGETPLGIALKTQNEEKIAALLRGGANPFTRSEGKVPLFELKAMREKCESDIREARKKRAESQSLEQSTEQANQLQSLNDTRDRLNAINIYFERAVKNFPLPEKTPSPKQREIECERLGDFIPSTPISTLRFEELSLTGGLKTL